MAKRQARARLIDQIPNLAHLLRSRFAKTSRSLRGFRATRLNIEVLEHRQMLTAIGLFERLDADVYAAGGVSVSLDNANVSEWFEDNGNADETLADITAIEGLEDEHGSASARIDVVATGATSEMPPDPFVTHIPFAKVDIVFIAETENDGSPFGHRGTGARTYPFSVNGGRSEGTYQVVQEELPDEPVSFHGSWILSSNGIAGNTGAGELQVQTFHTAEIITDEDTWYVYAQALDGHSMWQVTTHLPNESDGSYVVNGPLNIEIHKSWDYDDSEEVIIRSTTDIGAYASIVADYQVGTSKIADWLGSTEARLYLAQEPCPPGDYNDNGIVDAADYTVWRDNLGASIPLPNEDPLVTPGMVTPEDYDVWKAHFGEVCPEASSGQLSNLAVDTHSDGTNATLATQPDQVLGRSTLPARYVVSNALSKDYSSAPFGDSRANWGMRDLLNLHDAVFDKYEHRVDNMDAVLKADGYITSADSDSYYERLGFDNELISPNQLGADSTLCDVAPLISQDLL